MSPLDKEMDMQVDITGKFAPTGRTHTSVTRCRVTPKRVYTMGGAVFDRATGRQIIAKRFLAGASTLYRIDPLSIRTPK